MVDGYCEGEGGLGLLRISLTAGSVVIPGDLWGNIIQIPKPGGSCGSLWMCGCVDMWMWDVLIKNGKTLAIFHVGFFWEVSSLLCQNKTISLAPSLS